jgi:hypothetical protein
LDSQPWRASHDAERDRRRIMGAGSMGTPSADICMICESDRLGIE